MPKCAAKYAKIRSELFISISGEHERAAGVLRRRWARKDSGQVGSWLHKLPSLHVVLIQSIQGGEQIYCHHLIHFYIFLVRKNNIEDR